MDFAFSQYAEGYQRPTSPLIIGTACLDNWRRNARESFANIKSIILEDPGVGADGRRYKDYSRYSYFTLRWQFSRTN
ncbi:MAG: hypothetical protein Q7O66_05865 [Dehalococcoidia bacterium]|nr:hypothetical protein [Dehalococcoidia bacterium]